MAAEWIVGPIMEIINACSDYLEEQVEWQTGMKELKSLYENHPKIQVIVFAANQAQIISDQNPALNKWIWQRRDAVDEADNVLDEFEYMKLKEHLTKNMEKTEKKTVSSSNASFLIDPILKRLEEVVQKLDKVSGSLPTNDVIGREKVKDFVMQWLRKPSNEPRTTDLYRNISLLSIVGHGGTETFLLRPSLMNWLPLES